MEEVKLYVGLVLYDQKRFEICEYDCTILPNGMYKLPDNESLPKDRTKFTTAIHPNMLDKRIYLNESKNVNFIYYSLDKETVLFELIKCKEDYLRLQDSLIEQCMNEIKELNKRIDKFHRRKDKIEQEFSIKPVDRIRNNLR